MEKGIDYKDFPDVCVVFISEFDLFEMNQTLYHVCRVVKGTDCYLENGTHEVYVNTAVDDGSEIAELMQYFSDSSGYHENFKAVCNRVHYLKESNREVISMSSVIEEYAQRYHEEKMQSVIEEYTKKYEERVQSVIEEYAKKYHEERTHEELKLVAVKLLQDTTFPLSKISELTGLSEKEVETLRLTIA